MTMTLNAPRQGVSRPTIKKQIAPRCRVARKKPTHAELQSRAARLHGTLIQYIDNDEFRKKTAQREIVGDQLASGPSFAPPRAQRSVPRDMPAYLSRLCETELLTAEEERSLFRRMNYLKFRAAELRSQLDEHRPAPALLDEAERSLADAAAVRDRIVRANVRLVVAIVKKYVSPQMTFDDLLSDGIVTLLGAAEKFDYDRGFRFSTYAYRSIARNAYRAIAERQRESQRFPSAGEEPVAELAKAGGDGAIDERSWEKLRGLLATLLSRLDGRERLIVSARYALGQRQGSETFQSIADQLGVSKERVRQLEQRAVTKLRHMASALNLEELFVPYAG